MQNSLEDLNRRVAHLENTCCSSEAMKSTIKTQLIVESLLVDIQAMKKQQATLMRFMYVISGGYAVLQFLKSTGLLTLLVS